MTDYAAMQQQLNSLRKQMQESAKAVFEAGSKELFAKYPNMTAFAWHQYTPYFNDGDACEFSANTSDIEIEFASLEEDFEDDNAHVGGFATDWAMCERYDVRYGNKEAIDANDDLRVFKDVSKFLESFEEDDLETMFGDHAQIIVRPEGIEVEEYSHD